MDIVTKKTTSRDADVGDYVAISPEQRAKITQELENTVREALIRLASSFASTPTRTSEILRDIEEGQVVGKERRPRRTRAQLRVAMRKATDMIYEQHADWPDARVLAAARSMVRRYIVS